MMMTLEELMARFSRKEDSLRRDLWRFNLLPKVEVDDDGQWVQRWDENEVRQIYECGEDVRPVPYFATMRNIIAILGITGKEAERVLVAIGRDRRYRRFNATFYRLGDGGWERMCEVE